MSTRVVVVTDAGEVEAIIAAIAGAPLVAFDLEFLAQDRLVPTLCLVQIAWLPHGGLDAGAGAIGASPPARSDARPEVRLLDPLAVDLSPLVRALAAHPRVIAHAPRQDLALLAARFGVAMPAIVDTQLMAAFAGMGDQIGFATLANELLGLSLGKELQWTDWATRPLSGAQLAYAEADVLHLPAIYARLAARLGARLAWAEQESAVVARDAAAAAAVTPETAWQALGAVRGLDAPSLAAVVELAAWRQRTCVELDRPLGQVMTDKLVLELGRQRPTTAGAVRAARGLSSIARQRAEAIAAAIAAARPGAVKALAPGRPPSPRAQRWAEILLAIVQLVADETGVAARLLATRADAEELARAVDERGLAAADALPAFATWRREVIGRAWLGWLTGARALVGDLGAPHGIALTPPGG